MMEDYKKLNKEILNLRNELIISMIENDWDKVIENSYINCHAEGIDSIMLFKNAGTVLRMFVAHEGSKLHDSNFQVAIHPHRFDLKLILVKGTLYNQRYMEIDKNSDLGQKYNLYNYQSEILDNKAEFKLMERGVKLKHLGFDLLTPSNPIVEMKSKELHTVFCDKETTAWMVKQIGNDRSYKSIAYSKEQPVIGNNLYQPMTDERLKEIIEKVLS